MAQVHQAWRDSTLLGLTLADYRGGVPQAEALGPGLKALRLRAVLLKGQRQLNLVWRMPTRDVTANAQAEMVLQDLGVWMAGGCFRNAQLHTPQAQTQLAWSKKGRASLRVGAQTRSSSDPAQGSTPESAPESTPRTSDAPLSPHASPALAHNRVKQRSLDPAQPYLHALGVTDAQARVLPTMSRKWKQINKFIEVLGSAFERAGLLEQQALDIVDFGCGKAYLSFAVHDWLHHVLGLPAQVRGVELREDLVQQGQAIVEQLQLAGMHIVQGDVRHWPLQHMDVMIALHACDVATDHAIRLGVQAKARVIVCSPCCHKELRPQLLSPHPLQPILRHGVHLGQQAEMLTDGLRAMLLEAAGYDTQVFEFISLEHTNKNKMILGVRRQHPKPVADVLAQIQALKSFYGIKQQTLETLFQSDAVLPSLG